MNAWIATTLVCAGLLAQGDDEEKQRALSKAAREALSPITEAMEDVEHLRADFVQFQSSLLLDEPIVSEGRLLLRANPGTLVLAIDGDHPVRVRSDATSHQIHYVEEKRAERYVFERNRVAAALLACVGADMDALEKAFRVMAVDRLAAKKAPKDEEGAPEGEDLPRRIRISLKPTDEAVAKAIQNLELTVNAETKRVFSIRHTNEDGEEVILRLRDVELDPKDWKERDEAFSRDLPAGTKVKTRSLSDR